MLIDFGISTDKLFTEREVPFFDSRLDPVITKVLKFFHPISKFNDG